MEERRGPLTFRVGRPPSRHRPRCLGELLGVTELVQLTVVGRPLAFGQEQDHLLQHPGEHALGEQHQAHTREAPHQEAPHLPRIVRAQKLGGKDQRQAAGRLQEQSCVDGESGPRRGKRRQPHSAAKSGRPGPPAGLAREVLIPDIRGVPDHRAERGLGRDREKVPDLDASVKAVGLQDILGGASTPFVKLDSGERPRRTDAQASEPLRRGKKEGGFPTGWLKDPVGRSTDRPLRHVSAKLRRREERTSGLAQPRGIGDAGTGVHKPTIPRSCGRRRRRPRPARPPPRAGSSR